MKKFTIINSKEYDEWCSELTIKENAQISDRLSKIENEGYFGDIDHLGDKLYELCWKNGRRIYFIFFKTTNIILILGGYKNDQKKDIKKAKILIKRYTISR